MLMFSVQAKSSTFIVQAMVEFRIRKKWNYLIIRSEYVFRGRNANDAKSYYSHLYFVESKKKLKLKNIQNKIKQIQIWK